jgi:tetratricopeptide (TPR) repeat protein
LCRLPRLRQLPHVEKLCAGLGALDPFVSSRILKMKTCSKKSLYGTFFLSLCSLLLALNSMGEESDVAPLLEQASKAEFNGDYAAALKLYTEATRKNPGNSEAWAAMGEHLRFYAHDEKAASDAFKKALSVSDKKPQAIAFAWRGLGELAAKEQRDDEAIKNFKKSLEALPLADTHRSLCHLYCRQRKFKEAAEQAREAVKLNPGDAIAVLLYAAQLHRAGEMAEGRRQYDKALALGGLTPNGESAGGPIHCCVYYNAAGYLGVTGETGAAIKMLERFFKTPNHRHLARHEIETDADFESLKTLPEFQMLLNSNL